MDIDKETIKVLSADTRIEILKLLDERRKIAADISKKLNLAPSTVAEHLQKLEKNGLIRRKETGHKWIYYEITEKGKNLIKPKLPIHIILSLSTGFILTFFGITNLYTTEILYGVQEATKAVGFPSEITAAPTIISTINWFFVTLLIIGLVLIVYGLFKLRR